MFVAALFVSATIQCMTTLMQADIFFFMTTVCVVFVAIFIIIALAKVANFMDACRRLAERLADKAEDIGEEAQEFLERVQDSFLARLLFPPRRRKKK